MSTKSLTTALAAIAALGVAGHVSAQADSSSPGTAAVRVHYQDLNLDSEAGAKAMLHRIRLAAMDVCGQPDDALDGGRQYRACIVSSTDRSVAQLDRPLVTALNGGSTSVALAQTRP